MKYNVIGVYSDKNGINIYMLEECESYNIAILKAYSQACSIMGSYEWDKIVFNVRYADLEQKNNKELKSWVELAEAVMTSDEGAGITGVNRIYELQIKLGDCAFHTLVVKPI